MAEQKNQDQLLPDKNQTEQPAKVKELKKKQKKKSIKFRLIGVFIFTVVVAVSVTTLVAIYDVVERVEQDIIVYQEEQTITLQSKAKGYIDIIFEILQTSYEETKNLENLKNRYNSTLIGVIDQADTIIKEKKRQVARREISLARAKYEAAEEIRKIRFNKGKGYVWIVNNILPYPRIIMDPINPELEGVRMSDPKYKLILGSDKNLFTYIVEVCRSLGEGFVEYRWPRPGADNVGDLKYSYFRLDDEWDWVLSCGIYYDEIIDSVKEDTLKSVRALSYDFGAGVFWVVEVEEEKAKILMQPKHEELDGLSVDDPRFKTTISIEDGEIIQQYDNFLRQIVNDCKIRSDATVQHYWPDEKGGEQIQAELTYAKSFSSFNWIIGTGVSTSSIINNVRAKREEADEQNLFFIIKSGGVILLVSILGIFIALGLANSISKPLLNVVDNSTKVVEGDLTVKFAYKRNDEVGRLVHAIAIMVDTLKNLNKKIYVAIIILTKNLRILYQTSSKVRNSADTQAVTVEETQRNIQGLAKMVDTIMHESDKANNYAEQAFTKAKTGIKSMRLLESEMTKIETSSVEIASILGVINEIAEQTNL
ncbi:MAG: methyl-accepting chemotaxis protein, partial [Spirochaetes bacterium]|nr:methyl-accepting chemotaxis protein [Spirochaetota bacterium]